MDPNEFNPFGGSTGSDSFGSYTNILSKTENLETQAAQQQSQSTELRELSLQQNIQATVFNDKALEELSTAVNSVALPTITSNEQNSPTNNQQTGIQPNPYEGTGPDVPSVSDDGASQNDAGKSTQAENDSIASTVKKMGQSFLTNEESHAAQLVQQNQQNVQQDQQLGITEVDQVAEKQTFEKFSKEVFVAIEHKNGDIDIVAYDPSNKIHQAKSEKGELVWKKGEEYAVATDSLKQKLEQAKGKIRHVAVDGKRTEIDKSKVRKLTDHEAAEFKGLVTGYNKWNATIPQAGMQQALTAKAAGQVDEKANSGQITSTPLNSERVKTELNERQMAPQKSVKRQWDQISAARKNEQKEVATKLEVQRTNLAKKRKIIIKQQHDEETAVIRREQLRRQDINGEAIERQVKSQEICGRMSQGESDVSLAIDQMIGLAPDRLKTGTNTRDVLLELLRVYGTPLEGRQMHEIIIKTPQTLLERAQNGEEPFASQPVLVEWSNIVQYLGPK
ncbi:MAG: hypothetical protein LLG04_16935 [Parachlamydia sp.]|nr:hypothetical protein [Parachlamydia sp.]